MHSRILTLTGILSTICLLVGPYISFNPDTKLDHFLLLEKERSVLCQRNLKTAGWVGKKITIFVTSALCYPECHFILGKFIFHNTAVKLSCALFYKLKCHRGKFAVPVRHTELTLINEFPISFQSSRCR